MKRVQHLSIVHADIQGAELEMLHGAEEMFSQRAIDYVFISSHSNELHRDCIKFVEGYDYIIVADADLDDTFSYDGLIVARNPSAPAPREMSISRRSVVEEAES